MKKHKILAFDVFGTVVDWYSSVKNHLDTLNLKIDSNSFTLDWRNGYRPAIDEVIKNNQWIKLDDLHLHILRDLLKKYNITNLNENQIIDLNNIWHRLTPWSDSTEGLIRLKEKYIICTLSNGNISLLTNMAKHSNLPWDCILSAENFQKYKPDKDTYLGVSKMFNVRPEEVVMVATHTSDLNAAKANGLSTAYIERPFEYGKVLKTTPNKTDYDYFAQSILHLDELLKLP